MRRAGPPLPHVRVTCESIKGGKFKGWTRYQLAVWLVLKAFENGKSNTCWPKYDTLQELTGLSRRFVKLGIIQLEDCGAITVEHGEGRLVNVYTMLL